MDAFIPRAAGPWDCSGCPVRPSELRVISGHGSTSMKAFHAAWPHSAWRWLQAGAKPHGTLRLCRRAAGKETLTHTARAGRSGAAHIVKLWPVARCNEFAKG